MQQNKRKLKLISATDLAKKFLKIVIRMKIF